MTQMDADERYEDLTGMDRIRKGSFTMKGMKLMKLNPGARSPGDFAVPATNASPLAHARRAAGGE